MLMECNMIYVCEKCGATLNPNNIIWLPAYGKKQGLFPFGKDCAKKIKRRGGMNV
jgi:hypothetical protein